MVVTRTVRAPRRAFAAIAAVAASCASLGLVACSAPAELGTRAAELRAANESDLLSVPVEHVYEVSGFEIISPQALAALDDIAQSHVTHSGYAVLSDDVITASQFSFEISEVQRASFTLTEPAVIRRAEGETEPVHAVGEIAVGDRDPVLATLKLTPSVIDDETLEFIVDFELPSELPFAQGGLVPVPSEISARLTFTAEPAAP